MYKKCLPTLNLWHPSTTRLTYSFRTLNSDSTDCKFQLEIPRPDRKNESVDIQRARLLYQSRKRGMLENDLLLSTFACKYLNTFSPDLLAQYDKLINEPSNDWDLYNWLIGKQEPPEEFRTEVFHLLKAHTQNSDKELRHRQPALPNS